MTAIFIPRKIYKGIRNYFFAEQSDLEKVAFLFVEAKSNGDDLNLYFKNLYLVEPNEYQYQSNSYVELKDEMRPRIIKVAFDLNAALVEIHSHTFDGRAKLSSSDFRGLKDFVPHVMWRLGGKPYSSMVFSKADFDAVIWLDKVKQPETLDKLVISNFFWKNNLVPNGLSLSGGQVEY